MKFGVANQDGQDERKRRMASAMEFLPLQISLKVALPLLPEVKFGVANLDWPDL